MFETDADRESFLRVLGGTSVTGPRGQLTGVLEREYAAIGDEPAVESSTLRLTVRTLAATHCGIEHGTVLRIEDADYVVRGVQPDGTGMTVLLLEA